MACRKLRALVDASHTHAESPLRRLNVHISSTISTFSTASAYNGANVSSAQTRETVPTLMQLLEFCLRPHIIVEQFTVVPEAAETLAFHSGRRCKNNRLEARVVQLKIQQLPFSGTPGRATFVSMFN